jgi:NAD(P)-dependent dehydrogenase (short-subunit alcohol dehydrogenase family)
MDKVWLVTGSASGLGRNIAEAVLSDEEDSTFRLHLVLVPSRLSLRRRDALGRGRLGERRLPTDNGSPSTPGQSIYFTAMVTLPAPLLPATETVTGT